MEANQGVKKVLNEAVIGLADANNQLGLDPDAKEFVPRKGGFASTVSHLSCTKT